MNSLICPEVNAEQMTVLGTSSRRSPARWPGGFARVADRYDLLLAAPVRFWSAPTP
jgi:hypothetical protein